MVIGRNYRGGCIVKIKIRKWLGGGGVAKWFRALDLKSGGPGSNLHSTTQLDLFRGSPKFKSSAAPCK